MDEKEIMENAYNKLLKELIEELNEFENECIEYYKLTAKKELYKECKEEYGSEYYKEKNEEAVKIQNLLDFYSIKKNIKSAKGQIVVLKNLMNRNNIEIKIECDIY